MRFKGLDLNHLVTLEVLLVERHLTRASDRLNLTQPAVSNALTKLREHFDDPLLVRRGREMCPTPFAEQLLKPLQETLRRIHEIAAARPHFDPATASRVFRVVASDYITTVVLAPLMMRLRKIAPNVRVEQVSISADAIAKFCHGDADALIQPDGNEAADFPSQPLFTERFVCIAAIRNRSVGGCLTPEEFYSLPRVVPPHPRYWPDEHMDHAELAPALSLSFPNIPLFIANSDHIAVIPERLAEMFESVLPIRRVRLTRPPLSVEFTAKFHAAGATDPFIGWILDQMQEVTRGRRFSNVTRLPTLRLPTPARDH